MYNYSCVISNKSKIFEPFTLEPLTEINISEFNKVVIIVKEKGFDIN
jgi:hypothetical protein